ncbi:BPSL0067 family protein [Enterobacter sp. Bisph1]|uniref:BPSL0067 family protein n=1 Tax=Enterobacter sp. Bisph1 TaxID=1274399 RepID=UPI00057C32B1|nr:BPSL0067 family protein [Enterobacter sp. Bisph1]
MSYIAATPKAFIGKSVGSGQCVAFTQKAANMPLTVAWRRGTLVKGNTSILPGTAIATFDSDGRYGNHTDGRSHVAIYLGQDANGIQVLDQWMGHSIDKRGEKVITPHPVSQRTIRFVRQPRPENDGGNYYVVE